MHDNILDLDLEAFKIGKPTTKFVEFPSFYGLQRVTAPIYVYRATKQVSPCVVVTACVHGDEINGLRIAQSIMKKKFKLLKGTLIIIPVVNIYGFLHKQRYLPDRKDLNRCFPGSENGSFGSRFAHFLFNNINQYGDYFIDLHSGTTGRFNVPQVRCDFSNPVVQELLDSVSVPLVVNSTLRDGSLRQSINDLGKPMLVFEGGEGLRVDETITKYGVNLVQSLLAKLEMVKSRKKYNYDKVQITKTRWIRAVEGGFLVNKAVPGKIVKKGEVVGELRNISGDLIERIRLPQDGVILGITKISHIMSGDALYNVGFLDNLDHDDDEEFFDYFDFE